MVDIAPTLAPFLRRPPTPPKESTSSKLAVEHEESAIFISRHLLDTPDLSPSSSAEFLRNTSGRTRKKVDFSGFYKYDQPPPGSNNSSSERLRSLPPSRDSKASRSILKAPRDHNDSHNRAISLALDDTTLPAMLRSTTQHLQSDSHASRLDAYRTMLGCLGRYQDEPASDDLSAAMLDMTQCIKRDASQAISDSTSLDIQLLSEALKLCGAFLESGDLAKSIPEDFKSFIAEKAIASLEDDKTSKLLTTHYMHLLEKQKFSSKVMTSERVNRLLNALHTTTNRVKSSRVLGYRLMIYYRLIGQNRPAMVSKVNSWLQHLLKGLMSNMKMIRVRAITSGIEAGVQLGTSGTISKACSELLNSRTSEGQKAVEILSGRMIQMINSRDDAQHVPQIWSVIILLLRGRRRYIENWEHLRTWIKIMEECFNCSDSSVKLQANIAWSRLIFAVNVDSDTSPPMSKILKDAIAAQMGRYSKAGDKSAQKAKQFARNSYCSLIYYAMRPTASYEQLDRYWDLCVAQFIQQAFIETQPDVEYACGVVAALLRNDGQPRVWNENKANMNSLISPPDLPKIDPKWVRSRAARVASVFEKLYSTAAWSQANISTAPIVSAWTSFISAIGSASCKEIKVSADTRSALSHLVNLFQRILGRAVGDDAEASLRYEKVNVLLDVVLAKIDVTALNEKRITKTAQSTFECIPETPSGRHRMNSASTSSAVIHLLQLVINVKTPTDSTTCADIISKLTQVTFQSAHSRQAKLLCVRSLALLLHREDEDSHIYAHTALWKELAAATATAFKTQPSPNDNNPRHLGDDYRHATKILELGLHYRTTDAFNSWQTLYAEIAKVVEKEAGRFAFSLSVVEPLACALQSEAETQLNDVVLTTILRILEKANWPQNQNMAERTLVQLWGGTHGHQTCFASSLTEALCGLINPVLRCTYAGVTRHQSQDILSLLTALTSFLHASPMEARVALVEKLQSGLAVWIQDSEGALAGPGNSFYPTVKRLWALVASIIERVSESSNSLLQRIHFLIDSGLRSRHKVFLSYAVTMWNQTFGCEESLDYPDDLRKTLLKIRSITDIDVPGLPEESSQQDETSPFRFIESQVIEEDKLSLALRKRKSPRSRGLFTKTNDRTDTLQIRDITPSTTLPSPLGSRRSARSTPKARLRHNDSQIQFTAVESSPLGPDDCSTQILTDRQKEVRERQNRETAIFPEIITSPRNVRRPTKEMLPKLSLSAQGDHLMMLDAEEDTSPTFPPEHDMDALLGSSPTPSSSRNRSQERHLDDEPESSPPFVSSEFKIPEASSPEPPQDSSMINEASVREKGPHMDSGSCTKRGTDVQVTPSSPTDGNCVERRAGERNDRDILSDQEVFVDACSEPLLHNMNDEQAPCICTETSTDATKNKHPTGPEESATGEVQNQIVSPGGEITDDAQHAHRRTSLDQTDNDDTTAQLFAEMEGFQSSKTHQPPENLLEDQPLKRKASLDDQSRKRRRTSASMKSRPAGKVYATKGQLIADCVYIETRPVNDKALAAHLEPVIKRERSESPPTATILSTVAETPMPGRRSSREERSSNAGGRSRPRRSSTRRGGGRRELSGGTDGEEDDQGNLLTLSRTRRRTFARGEVGALAAMSSGALPNSEGNAALQAPCPPDASDGQIERDSIGSEFQPQSGKTGQQGGVQSSAASMLAGFRGLLDNIKHITLRPEEERAMVGVLFESVQQVHEAGRRSTRGVFDVRMDGSDRLE
ncbi:uncharacterized protein KY384_001995 [Bacidia gigantensis]|uniref:uncharacterized protein n=1 Tax=Bacidia gigantensis TaxID=2732470 RepID=UPI001D05714E|nr:uncharacterized protein KY384_001995 [Bacidia gigantensis]KAG8533212.1 hypothetical protein KY384_001995 [Bacidia gigantensis]